MPGCNQTESSKSSFQYVMIFKEPVCQKECRNGGRCIGPNRCDHYQAIWGYCCQRGQPIVADVHVSMATRDAIARSITELVRATGFLFDNLIQPHQQFLPGKQQLGQSLPRRIVPRPHCAMLRPARAHPSLGTIFDQNQPICCPGPPPACPPRFSGGRARAGSPGDPNLD